MWTPAAASSRSALRWRPPHELPLPTRSSWWTASAPPAVSERAGRRRESLGDIHAYYADLRRWDPSVDDPRTYFSTHAVSLLRALEVSLEGIFEEGLQARFERHRRVASLVRDGMGELGFDPLTDAAHLAPTLSVLKLPLSVADAHFRPRIGASHTI